ncbi:MAG TPA: AsnC family transcriptional regulator [Candidatus Thermoplasmatota archaeon]|nr:AsnC family transcriptional regulator [Candidatus Thermoplasmatota archaeon]
MDALDVRILRTMDIQPFGRVPRPPETVKAPSIARRLKVNPERVADRIARMERSGVIEGYEVYPNYRQVGYDSCCYFLRLGDDDRVDAAIDRLMPLEGVAGCYAFLGGDMCVNFCYRNPIDMERQLRVLVAIAKEGGEVHKYYDLELPTVRRPLSNLDWRIVKALRGNAFRAHAEVGAELGVSAKTVKRRFDRMGEEGAFFIIPEVDLAAFEGAVMVVFLFHLDPDAAPQTVHGIDRAFDDVALVVDPPTNLSLGNYSLGCVTRSAAEVEALRRRALAIKGVARVRVAAFRRVAEDYSWLDAAIEDRLRATREPAPSTPRASVPSRGRRPRARTTA